MLASSKNRVLARARPTVVMLFARTRFRKANRRPVGAMNNLLKEHAQYIDPAAFEVGNLGKSAGNRLQLSINLRQAHCDCSCGGANAGDQPCGPSPSLPAQPVSDTLVNVAK